MKKSLFTKLMLTYFIILAISYCLVAVFLSYWFYNYYRNQKANELIREGVTLNGVVSDYMHGKTDRDDLKFELSIIDKMLNAKILLVDNYGYVWDSSDANANMIGKQITNSELNEVRNGNIVVNTGSFKEIFKTPMMTVGIPMVVDNRVVSAVFLHTPINEITSALKIVFFVIWMSAFFAVLISALIIYYSSNKILIKPLEKINSTAKSIAKGEFDKRVELKSDDEIGDLAHSFNYMADSLQNLEQMRRSFIANISHELRSPMTSINGFITGIIDGTIPEEKWQYYLTIVHGEIKRLIRLINDLLDLARLESGEFSLTMGVFDINEVIRERIIKFEEKINKKKINVNVVLTEGKLKVKGDRDRIDQVITNLVDNAIKFVPIEGTLEIKTEIKEDRLLVSVYNNGPGIPKDEIKYIWDRFHKVDKARSKGGGTGLGLSIARQILNQHNETIWVESGTDGTKFTFTLTMV